MDTIKPKNFTAYETRCGFLAEVYRTNGPNAHVSTCHGQAIGAIQIPDHPASFAGWLETQWDAETGKSLDRETGHWDLVSEVGPIETRTT